MSKTVELEKLLEYLDLPCPWGYEDTGEFRVPSDAYWLTPGGHVFYGDLIPPVSAAIWCNRRRILRRVEFEGAGVMSTELENLREYLNLPCPEGLEDTGEFRQPTVHDTWLGASGGPFSGVGPHVPRRSKNYLGDCRRILRRVEQPRKHRVDGTIHVLVPPKTGGTVTMTEICEVTVRDCLGCSCLVTGGASRCRRCAEGES